MTYGPNSRIIGSNPSALFTQPQYHRQPGSRQRQRGAGRFHRRLHGHERQRAVERPRHVLCRAVGPRRFHRPDQRQRRGPNRRRPSPVYVEGAGTTGIQLGANGTIAFTASNSYSGSTTVASGRLLVNGSLYASSSTASTVTVSAGTLGGTGTIYGPVTIANGTMIEAGMRPAARSTLANGLTVPYSYTTARMSSSSSTRWAPAGSPGLVVDNGLTNVGVTGSAAQHARDPDHGRDFRHRHLRPDRNRSQRRRHAGQRRQQRHLRTQPVASQPGPGQPANQSHQPAGVGPGGDWAVLGCLDRAAWQRLERLGQFCPDGRDGQLRQVPAWRCGRLQRLGCESPT